MGARRSGVDCCLLCSLLASINRACGWFKTEKKIENFRRPRHAAAAAAAALPYYVSLGLAFCRFVGESLANE